MIVRPGDTLVVGIHDHPSTRRDLENLVTQIETMLDADTLGIKVYAIGGMTQNFIVRSDET